MNVFFILNDTPCATEPVYNGSRLALARLKKSRRRRSVFLMASSVIAAKAGRKAPGMAITISSGCSNASWPATARCFVAAPARMRVASTPSP